MGSWDMPLLIPPICLIWFALFKVLFFYVLLLLLLLHKDTFIFVPSLFFSF